MTYFIAAVAASGVFIAAGWRSKQVVELAASHTRGGRPDHPLWAKHDAAFEETSLQADAGLALRLVVKRLAPVMASQSVQAEVAASPGLLVRMRGGALADLLEELLAAAIHGAPASRILLAAAANGDRIHVSISDDMPGADAEVRKAGVRGIMQRVALRGGALDLDVRPSEGTTMTMRLAAVSEARQGNHQADVALPALVDDTLSPMLSSDMSR